MHVKRGRPKSRFRATGLLNILVSAEGGIANLDIQQDMLFTEPLSGRLHMRYSKGLNACARHDIDVQVAQSWPTVARVR